METKDDETICKAGSTHFRRTGSTRWFAAEPPPPPEPIAAADLSTLTLATVRGRLLLAAALFRCRL